MTIIYSDKKLNTRAPHDFYPTPLELCIASIKGVELPDKPNIIDPGCGTGNWGTAARQIWPDAFIVGIDIEEPPEGSLRCYNDFELGSYLDWNPGSKFDAVIGNPPFKYAEEFVRKSMEHLMIGGKLIFLLRLAFLESQTRGRGLWKDLPPIMVRPLVSRICFYGDHTDDTAYAIYCWEKGYTGPTELRWLDWKVNND